ncbi:alpha/beta hydrolase [Pelomyxa schiedti]|nr:alpha/beta hydrolase [Pelomyxa schiedti]
MKRHATRGGSAANINKAAETPHHKASESQESPPRAEGAASPHTPRPWCCCCCGKGLVGRCCRWGCAAAGIGVLVLIGAAVVAAVGESEGRHGLQGVGGAGGAAAAAGGVSVPVLAKVLDCLLRVAWFAMRHHDTVSVVDFVDMVGAGTPHMFPDKVEIVDIPAQEDYTVPAMRVFAPKGTPPSAGFPTVVYIHGGGFVLGSAFAADSSGFAEAVSSHGFVVISVEYRKAPRFKFPTAAYDADHAILWLKSLREDRPAILSGADLSRVAVMGDSAGALLSTVSAMVDRDRVLSKEQEKPYITFQVLAYVGFPGWDCNMDYYNGYLLSYPLLRWFCESYERTLADETDPLMNPTYSPNGLRYMPPAFLLISEYDLFGIQGHKYSSMLSAAGVPVSHKDYPAIHGFLAFPYGNVTYTAIQDIAQQLTTRFAV